MARLHYRDPDTGEWVPLATTGSSGGGGGVTDHGALSGLTDADHPIAAVQGLQTALDGKADTGHTHTIPTAGTTTPIQANTTASAVGTSADYARADHRHQVPTATPVALGSAAAAGTGSSLARADHVHPYPSAANVGADPAGTAAAQVAAHASASDPHAAYLRPTEVLAGTNVTIDTATTPGSVIISAAGGGGGDSGITDHGQLTGLTDPDHPISAVQGLQIALDGKVSIAGATMTGPLTATDLGANTVSVYTAPTLDAHATPKSYVDARHEVVVQLTQPAATAPLDLWIDPDAEPPPAAYVLSSGDEMTGPLASPALLMIGDIPPPAREMLSSENALPLLESSEYEGNLAATREWTRNLLGTGGGASEVHIGKEPPTDESILWMDTNEVYLSRTNASDLMTYVEEIENRLMRMEALLAAHGIAES